MGTTGRNATVHSLSALSSNENRLKIHKKKERFIEDDEKAQIEQIFLAFDYSGNRKVSSQSFGEIMRLLQYNIGLEEEKLLLSTIDRGVGRITLDKLIHLLQNYEFQEDTQAELMKSLNELDKDADGYIEKDEMVGYLKTMGEGLSDQEMEEFLKIAIDNSGDKKNMINLSRLAEILLPKIESENELTKGLAAGDGAKSAAVE